MSLQQKVSLTKAYSANVILHTPTINKITRNQGKRKNWEFRKDESGRVNAGVNQRFKGLGMGILDMHHIRKKRHWSCIESPARTTKSVSL